MYLKKKVEQFVYLYFNLRPTFTIVNQRKHIFHICLVVALLLFQLRFDGCTRAHFPRTI
jgi:hypothetical protein